jgi:hypothetical protein
VCGATESPDHGLDAELAVAGALEGLGFSTEIMEVALDLALIESLPSRRPQDFRKPVPHMLRN